MKSALSFLLLCMLLAQHFAIETNENDEEIFPVMDQIVAFFSRRGTRSDSKKVESKASDKTVKVKASNIKQAEVAKTTKVFI